MGKGEASAGPAGGGGAWVRVRGQGRGAGDLFEDLVDGNLPVMVHHLPARECACARARAGACSRGCAAVLTAASHLAPLAALVSAPLCSAAGLREP